MASRERPALASLSLNVTNDVNDDDGAEESTSCTLFASPVSRFAPSTRSRVREDDDRSSALAVSVSDAETRAIDENARSAIALLIERDAAIEREQAVVTFAREQMATFDEEIGALTRDVSDLMLALGEAHADQTRARWRWAIKTVVSIVRADRERREAKRAKARARRLEEQLRRVETYIAAAANDFDQLNAKLVKEAELVKEARDGERRALEMLESERKMRESPPSTPPRRRQQMTPAAGGVRAGRRARRAAVELPSKQLNEIARASTRRRSAPEPRSRAPPRRERAKASWIRKTSSPSSQSTPWSGAPNDHPATANAPSYAPPSVSRPSLASVPPAPPSSPARRSVIIIDRIHHITYVRAPPRASIPSRRPPRRSLAPSRPLPLQSSHESIQTIDCTFKPNICS